MDLPGLLGRHVVVTLPLARLLLSPAPPISGGRDVPFPEFMLDVQVRYWSMSVIT
ncbi:hypothetical protein [Streptomyces phaeochromogenes]|uniref:hypothetical protein n=1 Tax=Streptomyces phaeochromogenes TaxID=1923 RepID=UPI000B25A598|nr:hypothetical protein [Streptomyces phaeochromogenes]